MFSGLRFEWDPNKNVDNKRKHGISFEQAQTVFLDENAHEYFDPDHSEDEERFLMLGMSSQERVMVVSYCRKESESIIRIISARKAKMSEEVSYLEGMK